MPALNKVDVELVDNVKPYEEAKIRILNGGHTALCYLGALSGYKTFDEIMTDQKLLSHFYNFETSAYAKENVQMQLSNRSSADHKVKVNNEDYFQSHFEFVAKKNLCWLFDLPDSLFLFSM